MRLKYNFIGLILACGLGLSSCNDRFSGQKSKRPIIRRIFLGKTQKMPRNSQPESICI